VSTVVLLSKTGQEVPVSSISEFVDLVYGYGYRPKTGSLDANRATLLAAAPPPSPDPSELVRLGDLQTPGTDARVALEAAFVHVDGNGNLILTVGGVDTVVGSGSGGGGGGVNATDSGYDLILLLGQSNMSGRGAPIDTTHYDVSSQRIWQYGASGSYANVISLAIEPLAQHDTPTGIGPGLAFARWYADSVPVNRQVLLVPFAHGGTALSTNATPLGWRRGVSGNLYALALAQAQAALAAAGPNARITAALWLQGETDGDSGTSGAQYQADLDALIAGLRTDLALPNLPFVIGQMVPEYLPSGSRAAINTVQAATPSRLAKTSFATAPIGQDQGDGNHFNAAAQRTIGRNMFNAYQRIATGTADPALPASPGQVTGLTAVSANSTSVAVSWSAPSGAAIYYVEYKLDTDSTWTRAGTPTGTSLTVTGLTTGSLYDFRVTAVNSAGPGTASTTATATPGAATDTTAPSTPTGLIVGTTTATSVPLSWTASTDNVAVAGYRVYRGGTLVGSPTGTTFTDTGLTASTVYSYTVSAVDAAGNQSPQTAGVNATTASGGGGAVVSDSFNRADSTTSLGTADTGQAWTALTGTLGINGNAAYAVVTSNSVAVIDSGLADGTVQVKLTATATGSVMPRLIFRCTDASNYWMLQARGSTGKYQLYKNVAGAFTQLGTDIAVTPTAGDVIQAVLSGSSVTIKVNGVQAATATDAFNSTATKHGIGWAQPTDTTQKFDDFSVSA